MAFLKACLQAQARLNYSTVFHSGWLVKVRQHYKHCFMQQHKEGVWRFLVSLVYKRLSHGSGSHWCSLPQTAALLWSSETLTSSSSAEFDCIWGYIAPFMALRKHSGMTSKIRSGALSLPAYAVRWDASPTVYASREIRCSHVWCVRLHCFVLVRQMWRQIIIKDTTCDKRPHPLGEVVCWFFQSDLFLVPFSSCMELHFTGVKPRKEK